MKNALNICLVVVACIFMLTCSEAPELIPPNTPLPNPTPGPKLALTDEERLAVLTECSQTVKLIGDLKQETAQLVLVEWLKSRPEFADAGVQDGNVWAHFHDGRIVMFVPNWEGAGDDSGGRIPTDVVMGRDHDTSTDARVRNLPASNNVILFHGLGKVFTDDRTFLKGMFTRSHTRYNVYSDSASIKNLMAVSDLGIFYIRTHGGSGLYPPRSAGRGCFGLWTTDTVSLANEQTYLPELNSNMLVYMNAIDDARDTTEWHYGITSEFARHGRYMNFAPDAFLYVDACNGMTPSADQFKTTLIGETANDKGTYLGWTGPKSYVEGTPTARFIFDRLLGIHDETVPVESQVQRPFDWPDI